MIFLMEKHDEYIEGAKCQHIILVSCFVQDIHENRVHWEQCVSCGRRFENK